MIRPIVNKLDHYFTFTNLEIKHKCNSIQLLLTFKRSKTTLLLRSYSVDSYYDNNVESYNEKNELLFIQGNNLIKFKYKNAELFKFKKLKQHKAKMLSSFKRLKPSSYVNGFKKISYNSVKVSQNNLLTSFNRRKHNISHYNITLKEKSRLSRVYSYISSKSLLNYSAFTLNSKNNLSLTKKQAEKKNSFFKSFNYDSRAIVNYINFLECRLDIILKRNVLRSSISSARQQLRKGVYLNKKIQKKNSFPCFPGDVFFLN